jgi:hypothetical protein
VRPRFTRSDPGGIPSTHANAAPAPLPTAHTPQVTSSPPPPSPKRTKVSGPPLPERIKIIPPFSSVLDFITQFPGVYGNYKNLPQGDKKKFAPAISKLMSMYKVIQGNLVRSAAAGSAAQAAAWDDIGRTMFAPKPGGAYFNNLVEAVVCFKKHFADSNKPANANKDDRMSNKNATKVVTLEMLLTACGYNADEFVARLNA